MERRIRRNQFLSAAPSIPDYLLHRSELPVRARTGLVHRSKSILFDHLIREREQRWWKFKTECFCSLEIEHELELDRLHDWQVSRLLALENSGGVKTRLAICVNQAGSVAH